MNDNLNETLGDLPEFDMDLSQAKRIERRALAALAGELRQRDRPWLRLWTGVLEPSFAAAAVGIYLLWMVEALRPLL